MRCRPPSIHGQDLHSPSQRYLNIRLPTTTRERISSSTRRKRSKTLADEYERVVDHVSPRCPGGFVATTERADKLWKARKCLAERHGLFAHSCLEDIAVPPAPFRNHAAHGAITTDGHRGSISPTSSTANSHQLHVPEKTSRLARLSPERSGSSRGGANLGGTISRRTRHRVKRRDKITTMLDPAQVGISVE